MGNEIWAQPRWAAPASTPGCAQKTGLSTQKVSYRCVQHKPALRVAEVYAKRRHAFREATVEETSGVPDTILETQGLTKEFGGFRAVDGVDLQVERGTIHALIGPNGAGKTTCFNLLTSFLPPTRGKIKFKGRDITGMKPAKVARLGLIRSFQISAVFPHLTALESVRLALQRARGASFDFWRSEKVLKVYDDRAHQLL